MRILLLNQFFWPDSAATSQLLTDLARELSAQGHEVHAICAMPSYAVPNDEDAPYVTVHRIKASGFARGLVGRLLSYASFYAGAVWSSLRVPRPDIVLTLTTPPLISLIGNLLKIVRGSRHWVWEMDVYPDVALDLGYMKPGGLIERTVGLLADWSRTHADGVIALGECMKDRLIARGISANHIRVCDNWADGRAIQPLPTAGSGEQLRLLYSGNLGLAHDLDTMTGAMNLLKADPRFHFLFVGSGGRRNELAAFLEREQIKTVELLPYAKRGDLSQSLALGDLGLVTQRDQCCGSVVPSKVYGLMAAGRPILFIGPKAATPARLIERFRCGWHIACNDVTGLTNLLLHLAAHRDEVSQAGLNARQALLDHFDLPLGTARVAAVLFENPLHRSAAHASSQAIQSIGTKAAASRPQSSL